MYTVNKNPQVLKYSKTPLSILQENLQPLKDFKNKEARISSKTCKMSSKTPGAASRTLMCPSKDCDSRNNVKMTYTEYFKGL